MDDPLFGFPLTGQFHDLQFSPIDLPKLIGSFASSPMDTSFIFLGTDGMDDLGFSVPGARHTFTFTLLSFNSVSFIGNPFLSRIQTQGIFT
jgi:hypothetical protein